MVILGLSFDGACVQMESALFGTVFLKLERDFSFKAWVGDCEGRFLKIGWLYVVYDAPSVLHKFA